MQFLFFCAFIFVTSAHDGPTSAAVTSGPLPNIVTLPPVAELTTASIAANISLGQCQCSSTSDADGPCIAYNDKWQANSVEEAVETFRSPLDIDQTRASPMTKEEKKRVTAFFKDKPNSKEDKDERNDLCENDQACKTCLSGVYYLLAVREAIKGVNQNTWIAQYKDVIKNLAKNNGIPLPLVRDKCKQSASSEKTMNIQTVINTYYQVLSDLSCKTCMEKYLTPTKADDSHRAKRQSSVGTTIQVRCDYRRGQLIGDGTNYVGMCNLCWTIRQLPAEYSPRMLNEITCASDTSCLAGYGGCRPRYRATNVLYTNIYEMSINAQSGCECQVVSGSAFFPYVNA